MMQSLSWVNGQAGTSVDVSERALQYGDGLFETIRVYQSVPEFLARHINRLTAGCRRLKFPVMDWREISRELKEVAERHDNAVLKLILSRHADSRGYGPISGQGVTRIVRVQPFPQWPANPAESGICVRVCETRLAVQPLLSGIKHLNRLEQVLARAEWDDPAIAEGLMLTDGDQLVEGTMSNIFMVSDQTLITPDLTKCGVAGVMRSVILDLAESLGIDTEVRPVALHELKTAREVFVCNSLIGIWPVISIEGMRSFEAAVISRRLQDALAACNKATDGKWYAS